MRSGTIAFLTGVVGFQQLPTIPTEPVIWTIAGLLLLRWSPSFIPAWIRRLAPWAVAGFLWGHLHAVERLSPELPQALESRTVTLIGTIEGLPQSLQRSSRFEFRVEEADLAGEPIAFRGKVRLSWYGKAPKLVPGERWKFAARLKRPHGMFNPGGFDYERWLYQQGLRATGYVVDKGDNSPLGQSGAAGVHRVRQRFQEQIVSVLGARDAAAIIRALAIGDRDGITPAQWDTLTATGTNHLMAISGLHIGLVAGFAFFAIRRLWGLLPRLPLRLPAPMAGAWGAFIAAGAYAAMAGFSIPTQRAMVMVAVVMGAILWRRQAVSTHGLAVALMAVLLLDPSSVLSFGFWLSFGAVAVLFYAMAARVGAGGLWWKWGRAQWAVFVGLVPALLLFFQQLAPSAPLANLVAVPWVGLLVVPLTLVGTLLLGVSEGLGAPVLRLAAAALEGVWPLLEALAEAVPPLSASAPSAWALLPAGVGIALLIAPRGWPGRWVGVLWFLPLLGRPDALEEGRFRLALLDVGQGLAAVVRTAEHTLLFDTGPRFPSGFDAGQAVVGPFLTQAGIRQIDHLMISHGDSDHAGGAPYVLENFRVKAISRGGVDGLEACRQGQAWQWDGVAFQVLHPAEPSPGNNGACVLKVTAANGQALLLTGDVEAAAERQMLARSAPALRADVVIAPHHGSTTSSTKAFVTAVQPRYALFSVGYRNRFGFPRPIIVERYRDHAAVIADTAASGAIFVDFGGSELGLARYREMARRYWHDP